jgi:hypothetical protein
MELLDLVVSILFLSYLDPTNNLGLCVGLKIIFVQTNRIVGFGGLNLFS